MQISATVVEAKIIPPMQVSECFSDSYEKQWSADCQVVGLL